ncbi:MAG: TonB family protein [Burkholderiaceae bacterium]|nr:TonB family protein [Burkholderiaceae bacterium]
MLLLTGLPPAAAADDAPAKAHMATCAKPEWPKEALRKEQTGKVTLSFNVGADGTVLESVVKQSSGFPLLDEAARTALISCKFKPAMVDGRAAASWVAIQYLWTLEDKIDPAAVPAFDAMRERAALGDIVAQRELGTLYAQGKGVARSAEQAARWMTRAAQAGDAVAQFRMGAAYQGGVGVPADAAQAMAWYRKAAEQGYPQAQMVLGTLYQRGQGVPRDEVQALAWLRLAVAQNFGPAFTALASMTREGRGGIVADAAEARRLLRQGAALNDLYAQYHLGAELLSSATAQEQADGVRWLLKAAPLALPPLQALLGFAYRDGVGIARDYVQARAWLHKAAAQSWPAAQYALAVLTEQGLGGPRNDTEALALYQKAAREMPNAALRLADAAAQGELGMAIDPARAEEWRQKAAGMAGLAGRPR